jgi:pimeloyl-ACP methyl ester carboxylesterase
MTAGERVAHRRAELFDFPMTLPPVLLVPNVTELEWSIKPLIEDWTHVASYDAPGVAGEPSSGPPSRRAVAERGIDELDRRGWERCVIVGDEFGAVTAALLASMAPERTAALALGHPSLSLGRDPPRAALTGDVLEAFESMASTNYRAYARALTQVTQGSYDDDVAERYIERVPQDVAASYEACLNVDAPGERTEETLTGLDIPLLLAEHRSCLIWTRESFEDVTARFPTARTCSCEDKPSVSPVFVEALRDLCAAVASAERTTAG